MGNVCLTLLVGALVHKVELGNSEFNNLGEGPSPNGIFAKLFSLHLHSLNLKKK